MLTKKQREAFDIAAAWGDCRAVQRILSGLPGYKVVNGSRGTRYLVGPGVRYQCRRVAVEANLGYGGSMNYALDSRGTVRIDRGGLPANNELEIRALKRSLYKQSVSAASWSPRAERRSAQKAAKRMVPLMLV